MNLHLLFLILALRSSRGQQYTNGDAGDVISRLTSLERTLGEQDGRLERQERQMTLQAERLKVQGSLLRSQKEQLDSQASQIESQSSEIAHLKALVDDLARQNRVLEKKNIRLEEQENVIQLLQQQLAYQSEVHNVQVKELSLLQSLLTGNDKLLSKGDPLIHAKADRRQKAETGIGLKKSRVHLKGIPDTEAMLSKSPLSKKMNATRYSFAKNADESASIVIPPHVISTRSDDSGPLDVVVSQLSQQVAELKADVQTLKTSDSQQALDIQNARTSAFVHWGSSSCTSASQLVYSGIVGGSSNDHSGAETNYLCLTLTPTFNSHPVPRNHGFLYGSEYQTEEASQDRDPVCAVCRSQYSSTIMVPGTNVCSPGWNLQYSGYLMGGYYSHTAASEYICVDSAEESYPHSEADQNGKLMYYTVTHCGSLPCKPYTDNKVVLCAVCSK